MECVKQPARMTIVAQSDDRSRWQPTGRQLTEPLRAHRSMACDCSVELFLQVREDARKPSRAAGLHEQSRSVPAESGPSVPVEGRTCIVSAEIAAQYDKAILTEGVKIVGGCAGYHARTTSRKSRRRCEHSDQHPRRCDHGPMATEQAIGAPEIPTRNAARGAKLAAKILRVRRNFCATRHRRLERNAGANSAGTRGSDVLTGSPMASAPAPV